MAYTLPSIPYLKLKFFLTAGKDCTLNPMKGSMLRGAFGHALKRTVCVMDKKQPCETCMLRQQCSYTRIFETYIEGEPPPFLRGLKTSPRPYIIDAYDMRTQYKEGETLEFHLTLLGKVCELYPYVIFAVWQMAESGLAKSRIPFKLEKATYRPHDNSESQQNDGEQLLFDGQSQSLCSAATPSIPSSDGKLPSPLTLTFLTPTRLKFNNQLTIDFTFRMLTFKMLRRALEIASFYCPEETIDWEFHSLLEQADGVTIIDKELRWVDWERRSNQQKTKLKMGGFTGDITLDGDLEPFAGLLRLSEVLHIGKGTVFGLGKMVLKRSGSSKQALDE